MSAPNLPKTIRAWTIPKSGQPRDALLLRTDFPGPKPPSGDALVVRVSHAALNPADLKVVITSPLQDLLRLLRGVAVPGMDFAGEVVAAGPQAPAHLAAPGTRVCGAYNAAPIVWGNGSLAEYITVPASVVAQQPPGWTGGAAAGLGGIAGQTAEAIMRNARVQPGWRVLLVGISGGVGSILVQMLKSAGAVVFGVCSGSNAALAKSLGADEVIDYTVHKPLHAFLTQEYRDKPFDVIIDCAGSPDLFAPAKHFLNPGSLFITIVGGVGILQNLEYILRDHILPHALGGFPSYFRSVMLSPTGEFARAATQAAAEGKVTQCPVDFEYAMENAVEAYEKLETSRAKGKIVVKVHS